MQPLYEIYRPRAWGEVIGQDKPIKQLLALEIADPDFIQEIDASDLTPSRVKELEQDSHTCAWGRGGRVVIINEAHGMRRDTIRQLLTTLERLPEHVAWIFTTTIDGMDLFEDHMDSHPLLSRCICIALAQRDLCGAFAARAKEIAEKEGLDGQPIEKYQRLAKDCGNNFREILQHIEAGEMLS